MKVVKPILADTIRIDIFGQDGNDNLSVNWANCAMPAAHPLAHDPELPTVAVAALRAGGQTEEVATTTSAVAYDLA